MVIKDIPRKSPSFAQLANYILHEHDKPAPDGLNRFIFTRNLKGRTVQEWVKEYEVNESYRIYRKSNQTYCHHVIISFHVDDRKSITTAMLKDTAKKFAARRGIAQYIATPHFHQNAVHLHIMHGIEYRTGRSLRMSKSQFADLKRSLEAYQQERYPELTHSMVNHDKRNKVKTHDREYHVNARTGTTSKEKIKKSITETLTIAASPEEFTQLMKEKGITVYLRNGKLQGVLAPDTNRKHRFSRLGFEEQVNALNLHRLKEKEIQNTLDRIRKQRNERERER